MEGSGDGRDPLLLPGPSFKAGPTADRAGPGLQHHSSGASRPSETLEQFRRSSACSPSLDLLQSGAWKKGKTQTKPRF